MGRSCLNKAAVMLPLEGVHSLLWDCGSASEYSSLRQICVSAECPQSLCGRWPSRHFLVQVSMILPAQTNIDAQKILQMHFMSRGYVAPVACIPAWCCWSLLPEAKWPLPSVKQQPHLYAGRILTCNNTAHLYSLCWACSAALYLLLRPKASGKW